MAKLMFEIEDIEGGKMRIDLRGEGLATGERMLENTVTQNTAILLIATLRGVGIGVDQLPDLTPNVEGKGLAATNETEGDKL